MNNAISLSDKTELSTAFNLTPMRPDEFWEFCQRNPDLIVELTAEGNVLPMAPADAFGDSKNSEIIGDLIIWNRNLSQSGIVFGPSAGFTLPNGAVRSPDASWIPASKWNALTPAQREKFSHICPDFVVELMSPSDRLLPTQRKMDEYMANGARLGLLIDRDKKNVSLYRPNQTTQVLNNPTQVSCDPELPGFVLPLARIF